MNPASLLSESFSLNDPATSEGNYISPHVTGFAMDEDDSRRVGGLASMPDTNGVRYHAQQPAMQDLQYSGSSGLTMTPPDSCPDSFSPSSAPIFPHLSQLQHSFDRMDFRRVPALQPPAVIPSATQSSGYALNPVPTLMGRNNGYGGSYALHRGSVGAMGLPLAGMNDVPTRHQYSGTPRALENLERTQSTLYQQPMVDSSQRSQPQIEAPPFDDTTFLETIVADFGGQYQTLKPEVHAKMGRGFFPSDGKWTCYRRNYFSVTCGFGLHPWPHTVPLYIRYPDQTVELIRGFSMAISAIVNGQYGGETRELVQHTPKRDKQSERKPGRVILQPSPPACHSTTSASNGNLSGFPLSSQSMDYNSSFTGAPQPCQPPTSHMFERIQFQKATANNGKRRAQQQYYNLVVELYAEIASSVPGETQWIQIARRHSHPMVVRGRSPGHYKDGRRGSTASMGPDGAGADGNCKSGSIPHSVSQTSRSHMYMYDTSHRNSVAYGRSDFQQMPGTDHSPLSDSPLISSSSSSGFEYSMIDTMDPMDTIKSDPYLKTDPYLKSDPYQDPSYTGVPSHQHHQSTAGGYDPVYSTTYSRYDPIQSSHSLCT